jgi:type II secretory pathway component GspD/PulD (secretin)
MASAVGKPMTLFIDAKIADLVGYTPQGTPDIAQRETTSTLSVTPDQAIVISGLRSRQKTSTKGTTHPFERIPLLKNLFGNGASQSEDIQTFVVIVPRVFNDLTGEGVRRYVAPLRKSFIPLSAPTPSGAERAEKVAAPAAAIPTLPPMSAH